MSDWLDTGLLTRILSVILDSPLHGMRGVSELANSTMRVLVLIELLLFGLYCSLGSESIQSAIVKVLQIGFFQFLILKFGWLADTIRDSMVKVGLVAAGNQIDISAFMDPSAFIEIGFDLTHSIFSRSDQAWYYFILMDPLAITGGVCVVIILFSFVIMGWQIFFAIVEFYFKATLAVIFLPFGVIKQTHGLARNAIDGVVGSCVKLMVLAFVSSIIIPVVNNLRGLGENPTFTQTFSLMVGCLTMALLMWRAPAMAASLLGNTSAFDVGSSFLAPAATTLATMASAARLTSEAKKKKAKSEASAEKSARLQED